MFIEVEGGRKNIKNWIENEEEALKVAFQSAKQSGKLFNVLSWKMKRERDRVKRKKKQ